MRTQPLTFPKLTWEAEVRLADPQPLDIVPASSAGPPSGLSLTSYVNHPLRNWPTASSAFFDIQAIQSLQFLKGLKSIWYRNITVKYSFNEELLCSFYTRSSLPLLHLLSLSARCYIPFSTVHSEEKLLYPFYLAESSVYTFNFVLWFKGINMKN